MKRLAMLFVVLLILTGCTPAHRRAAYLSAHPEVPRIERQRIEAGYIWRGMTTDELRASWGGPRRRQQDVSSTGARELWVYGSRRYPTWVFVRGNRVTGWNKPQ